MIDHTVAWTREIFNWVLKIRGKSNDVENEKIYEREETEVEDNDVRLISERTNDISLSPCGHLQSILWMISLLQGREKSRDRAYPFYRGIRPDLPDNLVFPPPRTIS